MGVDRAKLGAEDRLDRADGERKALVAIERRGVSNGAAKRGLADAGGSSPIDLSANRGPIGSTREPGSSTISASMSAIWKDNWFESVWPMLPETRRNASCASAFDDSAAKS